MHTHSITSTYNPSNNNNARFAAEGVKSPASQRHTVFGRTGCARTVGSMLICPRNVWLSSVWYRTGHKFCLPYSLSKTAQANNEYVVLSTQPFVSATHTTFDLESRISMVVAARTVRHTMRPPTASGVGCARVRRVHRRAGVLLLSVLSVPALFVCEHGLVVYYLHHKCISCVSFFVVVIRYRDWKRL